MDKMSIFFAVISIVVTILFATLSLIASIIVAVWSVGKRFAGLDARLAGLEAALLGQNYRLEMMEKRKQGESQ